MAVHGGRARDQIGLISGEASVGKHKARTADTEIHTNHGVVESSSGSEDGEKDDRDVDMGCNGKDEDEDEDEDGLSSIHAGAEWEDEDRISSIHAGAEWAVRRVLQLQGNSTVKGGVGMQGTQDHRL